jgi:hypothetical protein
VGWLSGGGFHAGVVSYEFVHSSIPLPAAAERILPGQPAGVLALSGRELWMVEVRPEAPEPVEDEEGGSLAVSRPPTLLLQQRLPLPGRPLAAALSQWGIAVVCSSQDGGGLDLFFAPAAAAAAQADWRKVHLRGARALPGADPLIDREEEGGIRVSLLVVTPAAAASNGRAGVVHLGFNASGEPAYWPGLGWERPWPLPAAPEGGALKMRRDPDTKAVRYDWCVAMPRRQVLSRFGSGEPVLSVLSSEPLRPLCLFGLDNRLAVATAERAHLFFEGVH